MVRVVFILCLFGLLIAPPAVDAGEPFDRILAIVNEQIITQSELNKNVALSTLGAERPELDPASQLKLLEQLVERRLLEQEAKSLKIAAKDKDVDRTLQDVIERNTMTMAGLQKQLARAGLSIEDLREAIRSEITTSDLVGQEVHSKITVSDADMERYYNENIRSKEQPGARVRLKQILLTVSKDFTDQQIAALGARAESIRAQLEAGASFEEMAATYSQCPSAQRGGDLGFFYKGQLLPVIEQAAFSLPLDTVSPVLRSAIGFHIIKITERDEGDAERSWRTHARDIRAVLYSQAFEQIYTKWYTDLRARSYIEFKK